MIKYELRDAYIELIANNEFTHSLTLKPNSVKARAAGPAFRVLRSDQRFQLTGPHVNLSTSPASMITCNFNDDSLFSRLSRFYMLLDRRIVGRRFNEPRQAHLRSRILAVAEGDNATGHLHCAIKVHETRIPIFNTLFPAKVKESDGKKLWTKISPGGTVDVDELYNPEGWASYIAKSFSSENFADRIKFLP